MNISKELSFWINKSLKQGIPKENIFRTLIEKLDKDPNSIPSIPWIIKKINFLPKDVEKYILQQYAFDKPKTVDLEKTTYQCQRILEKLNQNSHFKLLNNLIQLYYCEQFLSEETCDQLIQLIKAHNQNPKNSNHINIDESNLLKDVTEHLASTLNLSDDEIEPAKVEIFKPEISLSKPYIDPLLHAHQMSDPGTEESIGLRTWKIIIYLNEVKKGGTTSFPNLKIAIQPKMGSIAIWNNLFFSGEVNPASSHINNLSQDQHQYIITLWLREGKKIKHFSDHTNKTITFTNHPIIGNKELTHEELIDVIKKLNEESRAHASIALAEHLLTAMPRDPKTLEFLTSIYIKRGRFQRARELIHDLKIVSPRNEQTIINSALLEAELNHFNKAIFLLESLFHLYPNSTMGIAELGEIYKYIGDKDNAAKTYMRGLDQNPENTSYYLTLCILLKEAVPQRYIKMIKTLINNPTVRKDNLGMLYFALANHYQKTNFKLYIDTLIEANNVYKSTRHWDPLHAMDLQETRYRYTKELKKLVPTPILDNHGKKPILIATLPRSGGTLLENILSAHTEISSAGESKSLYHAIEDVAAKNHLEKDYTTWPTQSMPLLLQQLGKKFKTAERINLWKESYITDKTIGNFQRLGLAMLAMPDAKVIHLKRHPMDTLVSIYESVFTEGFEFIYDLEMIAYCIVLFDKYMCSWKALFPNQIYTLEYEDIVLNQEQKTKEIIDFIGLEWEPEIIRFYERVSIVKTKSNFQVRQPIFTTSLKKWKKYEKYLNLNPAKKVFENYNIQYK